ncbi:MAG: phosphoribosylanthranilate isomerase [Treponema sp.]|jgi:phosphoribosylanthranilate isomerase|nr:phosphoribosylanthranilate isomerase [Treponema sp.]
MPKIKICGLFRSEDTAFVNEAEPDYTGFVFAKSRRQVSAAEALRLREKLKDGIIPVGVFVNAPIEEIHALYRDGVIAAAQLHGGEDEAYIAALKALCPLPVIKALRGDALQGADTGRLRGGADYLLFDGGAGGAGTPFDWSLLDPAGPALPWFLAGGITADNIRDAAAFNPYGIDVSSGAETRGVKDKDKIIRLVELARHP